MSEKSIADLKKEVDIVDYISNFIELKKVGSNFVACCPFHAEDTPSFSVSPTKQICSCFGGCNNGRSMDILDFIEKYHKVSNVEAINMLKAYTNNEIQTYNHHNKPLQRTKTKPQIPQKTKEQIQLKLTNMAKALVRNSNHNKIFTLMYPKQNKLHENSEITCWIEPAFEKLFEKKYFTCLPIHQKRLNYLLTNILSFDTKFLCPTIILKDHKGKVCDIAKYRPQKPSSFNSWSSPKYMYIKQEDKLPNRGEDFLYPFSIEMDKIIEKNDFFLIGEGLKNSFNALVYGVPFISIESSSTNMTEQLKKYILEKAKTKQIIGAFDGDCKKEDNGTYIKGYGAYLKAKKTLGIEFGNLFAFDSDIDFTDYLKDELSIISFEDKFGSLFKNVQKFSQPQ